MSARHPLARLVPLAVPAPLARRRGARFACLALVGLVSCGRATPPPAPVAAVARPTAAAPEPPVDLSEVPEPAGLVAVGRVANVERMLTTIGGFTHLPLPDGRGLLRSMLDGGVADVVDLRQPVDGAVTLGASMRSPTILAAVAVPVTSVGAAKAKLEATGHTLTARSSGQWLVEGALAAKEPRGESDGARRRSRRADDDEQDEETVACVLSPAVAGARLVCGERDALEVLVPYLTRTAPRRTYPADVHLEVRPTPVREPLLAFRSTLPVIARSALGGSTPAVRDVIDAATGELVDLVTDIDRVTIDATVTDAGVELTSRVDHGKTSSTTAQAAVANPERAEAPPAAFWRLPSDTDLAGFGRGSEPKLFERPRQLLGALLLDALEETKMPEAERRAARDLFADRVLPLFVGPVTYGKGTDAAALARALDAKRSVSDLAAADEAEQEIVQQVFGWHLAHVAEPISKVGPVLKDLAQLWARPSFARWAKAAAGSKAAPTVKLAKMPPGVALPKDAVHLELSVPRSDLVRPSTSPKTKPKALSRKPVVVHLFAVPDAGATWLGLGLDPKLVAQRATVVLSSAKGTDTLAKVTAFEGLREVKANGGVFVTLRGVLSMAAAEGGSRWSAAIAGMPNKGTTVIPIVGRAEAPGPTAPAGASVTTVTVPKAAIEDLVRFFFSMG